MGKIFFLLLIFNFSLFAKTLDVGVILENHSECSQNALDILKDELNKNFAGTNFSPKITEKYYLTNHNIQDGINKLNANSKIDAVFILTCAPLENITNLKNNKFYSVPLGFGDKGYNVPKNLNYIYSNLNLNDYLMPFKDLNGITEIDVLISNMNSNNLNYLAKHTNIPGIKVNVLRATKDNLLNAIDKKIPSFLIDFNEELKPYAYSGLNLEKEFRKRLRAASLNYMFFKTQKDISQIVEVNPPIKDIYLNSDVASKIDVYPNLIFLQSLSQVNFSQTNYPKLSLKFAIKRALDSNLDLLQVKQNVFSNFYNVKVTNSKRLPQLSANMDYAALDDRSPSFKQGSPTNSVNSYLELSQVIFSDQINASVFIEKLALDSSRKAYDQQKLDTIYYVASTYVNILQLKAQFEIQMSNYNLLRETLNIAQINYNVGAGGLQDVYRLQSDVAGALSDISNIQGEIRAQEIYLNNLLNYPQGNSYTYENLDEVSSYFLLNQNLGKNFTFGSDKAKRIENFLVHGAINNSNSLKQIDNNIKSKEREYVANKRERYLPTVTAAGNYYKNNVVTPWGQNSNKDFPDEYWQAGINVSLPLISGGEIYYNGKVIQSELQALEYNKLSAQSQLSKQVLQTYTTLLSNFVQSYTTKISSDVAKKNLDIVKNLYAEGTITITDFLSAQNNTLSQELNHVIENFNLINSTLKLENLYGKSSLTMSDAERKSLLLELQKELGN
ncbi:TolC family protein [Cetobacterium somerae]|uniref:TolC family protein n=1 Tax=Cetobacterium sp. NK01 TaxID=2993530 RepID=UPI002116C533|nr:TolC family protein [Cetobacterium sp. NK01]MCQ8212825.1 TolC family protein [Cetobacterium sp. NK01]